MTAWKEYCKSGKKPHDIPSHPDYVYKNEGWKGIKNWLGTENKKPVSRHNKYRPFVGAREFTHKLGIISQRGWHNTYCKSGNKPPEIPSNPHLVYKNEGWKGWGDWLGTNTVAPQDKEFLPFEEAKKFVHSLGLKSDDEWREYCKSGNKPPDIPSNPNHQYKNEWIGIWDWLGYEESYWSVNKVKELLKDLIESRIIYQWNEGVLYSLLLRKGVLNLTTNRHKQFFNNLIEASHSAEGRKAIEEYSNSDSEIPPDIKLIL